MNDKKVKSDSTSADKFRKLQWRGIEFIIALILIVAILCSGSGMISQWVQASRGSGPLLISLRTLSNADYSVDQRSFTVPNIELEIIDDILSESDSSILDKPLRTIVLASFTQTPTQTATGTPVVDSGPPAQDPQPEVTSNPTKRPTANPTMSPSSTPTLPSQITSQPPKYSPKPGNTQQPKPTLTATQSPPRATPMPSATNPPPPTATNTPTLMPQPSATQTPRPSPTRTPQPSSTQPPPSTPTSRPPTLVVTPTSGYTPEPTGFPYPGP